MDSPVSGQEMGQQVNSLMDGSRAGEPIAIIGIGCRFPGGADDPDSFWKLLEEGVDAITEVPADRWNVRAFYDPDPGKPGKTQARWGGFVAGIDRFDPQFFGISPREAARMDPQQRLLLETAWEAIEDGGQTLERLRGSRTAVFVGISSWDYSLLQTGAHDLTIFDVYSNTGGSLSIAANRISYCLDLRGPSAAVDTACSSALVAVHLACRSIWEEGCSLALAGGVNALLMPDWYVGFSRLNMLSPDGRCKAFDARANGFVRSEGAGMILLKPLGRALADGDRVHAVIRATAINQDGRTPGMTVPSQEAQEALLREACRQAGIAPAQIHYIEAHGTGTLVGDPIEARALAQVLSTGRPAGQPCWIGSVKTNIGHLEAAAGIAGLIKAALVLEHRRIPANLHFQQPNPEIDFERLQLRVPVRTEPWPQTDGPALAGVNSFGYGGTNAHVLLQEAPRPVSGQGQTTEGGGDGAVQSARAAVPGPQAVIVPLSARGPEALRAAAEAMARFVQQSGADVSLRDLAGNAARRRSHHDHRLAVVAASKEQLVEELSAFAAGQPSAACSVERVAAQAPRLAFVCCGQGPQWWAMGRQLLSEEPIFRDLIERCDAVVRQLGPWSLLEELTADESRSRLEETAISQPAIFALQAALAELWRSWGVRPEAVIGHSVGEVAAAWLAGVFSLEDAVRVIYHRGRCMDRASSRGRMLAAGLTPDEALGWIEPYEERLALAAVNSPASVTLSGEAGALEEIARRLEAQGVFNRFLQVQYAFHSAQMEPVREPLLAALDGLKPADARLPFFSTVTGQGVHGPELGAEYWWHNVRRTVRFADGVEQLIELGCDTVLELGPHPVLTASVSECYQRRGKKVTALYSLRRHEMEGATMRRALGALHVRGWPVDWAGVFAEPCRFVRLPSYPWQRERYWHELEASRDARLNAPSHPLLGWRRRGPAPCWQGRLDLRLFGWLADHRVQRSPIMPAAAYIDLALAAAHEHLGSFACQLEDIQFANPCFLSPERPLHLHTTVSPDDGSVRIHTRVVEGEPEWTLHFSAALRARAADEVHLAPETIQSRCPRQFAGADCFVHFEKIGLDYGPLFKGIQHVWQGENESLGRVELPDGLGADAGDHLFHPALLDACLQVVIPAEKNFQQAAGALYLPIEVERFRLHRRPGRRLWSHARLVDKTSQHVLADLDIYDDAGTLVAEVRGLRSQRVAGRSEEDKLDDLLFSYRWQEQDLAGASGESDGQAAGHWLILADAAVGGRLAEQLRARGQECTVVFRKDGVNDGLDPAAREPIFRLVQEQAPRLRGIVHLWNLDAPAGDDLAVRDLEAAQELGLLSVVHLIQAWDAAGSDRPARLFLVTRGAQPMEDLSRPLAIAQTPALGLGRVIIGEYPRLRCKLVDLDPDDVDGLGPLIDEMLADDEEDEVAYRGGKRYVHRFLPGAPEPAAKTARQGPFRLGSLRPGTIDGLALRPWQRQRPGPGQVEIAVAAAGLNFSDVMKALGIYPGLPDGPVALGAECSGIVTAVGAGVANVRPGEAVLAVAPFSFASHVLTRAEFVVRKPAALSFEQAAATPIAYLTAAYALDCLARLAPGERVLIHSATGGVGLAAIELARRAGAQIFATAGSAEKRDHLRRLGIEHVMDSRSLAFADEVLERTAGRGVDVILNSLAGEAIPRGLAILADHGRFLEIGKRDIYQNSRLGLRPFRKNLSFFAIDLDRMMHTQPALLGTLLEKLVRDLADGRLTPLPVTPYPIAEAADAFRLMQHGKHMGKVVLRVPEAATITDGERPVEGRPADRHPHSSDPRPGEGSYLVVGGLGGFGLAAARWLAQCKAGHLVLVGRRGSRSPDAARAVAELEPLGAGVSVVAADVAREEDVVRLLADIDRTLPPLRGVIHSAMVLEDGLLVKLERTQLYRVLAPKLNGAWNLHRHTRQRQLDFFVLFSSLASVLGHAGQAAYAAANAFLDALAHHRRALGLPALAVNWGHLGEVGYLAVHRDVGARLERQGVLPFTVREALAILERSLEQQQVQVSVMRTDWSRWRAMGVSGRLSPRFAHLGRQAAADSSADLPTLEAVRQAAPDQRRQLLQRLLRAKVARVLGTAPERLDDDKPLLNLGIDSLMAVELRNWIEGELRVNLPIVELMRSPSLSSLSELLSAQLAPAEPAAAATPPPDGERAAPHEGAPERLLANLDELSGEQVDALLSSLLADREAAPRSGAV